MDVRIGAAALCLLAVGLGLLYLLDDEPPGGGSTPPAVRHSREPGGGSDSGRAHGCAGDPACVSAHDTLWYQSSNGGRTGTGALPDYRRLFTRPQRWPQARAYTDVMQLRSRALRDNPGMVEAPVGESLASWDMPAALNSTVVTTYWCRGVPERRLDAEFDVIARLLRAGADLRYIEFQSALSKEICPASLAERVQAARAYVRAARQRFPQQEFIYGVTDAQLAKQALGPEAVDLATIRDSWRALDRGLRAEGTRLGFIHLDHPYEAAHWDQLRKLAHFIEHDLGASAGITYTANSTDSEREYYRKAIVSKSRALRRAGISLQHHVVNSWFTNPRTHGPLPASELPEDAPAPRYPMTKLVLRLGQILRAQPAITER